MPDDAVAPPDPTAWWSTLPPEARKVWFQLITGWSIEDTIKAAFARATGEPVKAKAPEIAEEKKPMPDLLPCPFCGETAELDGVGYKGSADCYEVYVRCSGCSASTDGSLVDQSGNNDEAYAIEQAVAAWNRRADLPSGYKCVNTEVSAAVPITFIPAVHPKENDES